MSRCVKCFGGNKVLQRKLVILGDGACGKTSLLNVYTRGYFPQVCLLFQEWERRWVREIITV